MTRSGVSSGRSGSVTFSGSAAFAVREPRHTAPRNGQPVEEDPTLPKAIVPDWVRAENEENGASDRSADA